MKTSPLNHSRDGLPEIGGGEIQLFGKERYDDLLREAEQYRLEHRALAGKRPTRHIGRSLMTRLLIWVTTRQASWRNCSPVICNEPEFESLSRQ